MLTCVCSVIEDVNIIISHTLGCRLVCHVFVLTNVDVICDLLLNRRMATWNLFVNCNFK